MTNNMNVERGLCSAQKMIDIVLNDKGVDAKNVVVEISQDYIKEHFAYTDKPITMSHYSNLSNDDLSLIGADYLAEAEHILVYMVVPAENPPSTSQTITLLSNLRGDREMITFGVDECGATDSSEIYLFSV